VRLFSTLQCQAGNWNFAFKHFGLSIISASNITKEGGGKYGVSLEEKVGGKHCDKKTLKRKRKKHAKVLVNQYCNAAFLKAERWYIKFYNGFLPLKVTLWRL